MMVWDCSKEQNHSILRRLQSQHLRQISIGVVDGPLKAQVVVLIPQKLGRHKCTRCAPTFL